MKLMIGGSRSMRDYDLFCKLMKQHNFDPENIKELIHGCAIGVDSLADKWGINHDLKMSLHPANWKLLGKSAGFMRNIDMIERCTFALFFWDGKSNGTKHAISIAKKLKKPHKIIYYEKSTNSLF